MDRAQVWNLGSRFATVDELLGARFREVASILDRITIEYELPDHSDVNRERYPWSVALLGSPALYGSRLWEYPYAILSAELQPGMRCADLGCGMTAFTVYLKNVAQCNVVGVDLDLFESGIRYHGHGVSKEFLRRTGIEFVQSGLDSIDLPSNSFDRVFCVSVIEHLTKEVVRRGVAEITRITKPGGRVIFTVDVNMLSELSRPMDLIWDSGLIPLGELDLRWPGKRFGNFCDGKQPADVFGLVLTKETYSVETRYSGLGAEPNAPRIEGSQIPRVRSEWAATNVAPAPIRPLWRRAAGRAKRAARVLFTGQ